MRLKFTKGIPTFYVDEIDKGVRGRSKGFWILIDKEYEDDEGLHMHEVRHVQQFFQLGIPVMLLLFFLTIYFSAGITPLTLYNFPEIIPQIHNLVPVSVLSVLGIFTHKILYNTIDKYKYWAELDANRVQLKYPPASKDYMRYVKLYARKIAYNYDLDVDYDDVLKDLLD